MEGIVMVHPAVPTIQNTINTIDIIHVLTHFSAQRYIVPLRGRRLFQKLKHV